jgi:D-glucuronyl C5-epimerase C-terminus
MEGVSLWGYYFWTVVLKIKGVFISVWERMGWLDGYKNGNRIRFAALFDGCFGLRADFCAPTLPFSFFYTAYKVIDCPDDLARLLVFDGEGIPKNPKGSEDGGVYNPLFSAYWGLVNLNHHLTCESDGKSDGGLALKEFWRMVGVLDTFLGDENEDGSFRFWNKNDFPLFELKAPWMAGITQGIALSLFIRAYGLSGSEHYKRRCRQIVISLFVPVEKGGVLSVCPDGFPWIEEYPCPVGDSCVLNGFVFSLIGLYEYRSLIGDGLADGVLFDLSEGLMKSLYRFRIWGETKYSLRFGSLSNFTYRGLYVYLWEHLYVVSGRGCFLELSKEWNVGRWGKFRGQRGLVGVRGFRV